MSRSSLPPPDPPLTALTARELFLACFFHWGVRSMPTAQLVRAYFLAFLAPLAQPRDELEADQRIAQGTTEAHAKLFELEAEGVIRWITKPASELSPEEAALCPLVELEPVRLVNGEVELAVQHLSDVILAARESGGPGIWIDALATASAGVERAVLRRAA